MNDLSALIALGFAKGPAETKKTCVWRSRINGQKKAVWVSGNRIFTMYYR